MPNDEVKISQLPVGTLGNGSLFETSEVNGEGYASTKVAASDLGNYVNTVLQYAGLKTAVLNVVGAVNSVLAIFADEYNTTTYYNPGWYCIKDGVLYVCQNDTHGTWSEGAWTETTVNEALRSMKSEIEYFDLIKFNSDNVAAFHSTTTAYSKGDYCINDEDLVLYRAKVDIPTGTAWDDTKWEAVTIGGELKSLNEQRLDDLPVVTMPYSAVATFNTDRAVPLADVSCQIVAQQSGSGDPSPSNIRSISGFSKCNIIQSDNNEFSNRMKSVFDGTYGFVDLGTLTWIVGTGGQARFVSSAIQSLVQIPSTGVLADIVCSKYKTVLNTAIYNDGVTGIAIHSTGAIWVRDTTYSTVEAFTAAMSGVYLIYRLSTATTPSITDAQITAITSAFSAVPVYIPLGTTVYGGTVDVTTGLLTVTHGYIASYNGETINEPWISSMDKYVQGATPTTGAQVVYPLTTPTTVQLTPTEIDAFLGQNNIFCDTGDTSVAYRESAQKYIDENTGLSRAKVYSLNLSQGGAWINTGVDMTNVDTLMFERNDNGDVNLQVVIKKSQIAVYTGGADVYTMIYNQGGKPLNVRIYNNVLYASYNGTGAATYVTNVYALKDVF